MARTRLPPEAPPLSCNLAPVEAKSARAACQDDNLWHGHAKSGAELDHVLKSDLGHFDNLLGQTPVNDLQDIHAVFHHLRHRSIENRYFKHRFDHEVPLDPLLWTRHGCQPVWSGATGGRHFIHVHGKVLGACRLGSGGPPDRRRVVQLAPTLPGPGRPLSPWGGVVLVRCQEHLQRELLVAPVLTQPTPSAATGAPRSTATRCAVNIHDVNS